MNTMQIDVREYLPFANVLYYLKYCRHLKCNRSSGICNIRYH